MSGDRLDIDLEVVGGDLERLSARVQRQVASGVHLDLRLGELEQRVRAIQSVVSLPAAEMSWDDLVYPRIEGNRPVGVVDPHEVAETERRFVDGFRIRTSLDRYDIAAGITAGIVAALVDALVVRIPTPTVWAGERQEGAALTRAIRAWAASADNVLADWAQAGFDAITGIEVHGMGPMTHRVQTFGHDPLLGLVLGTIDIMRGTIHAVAPTGQPIVVPGALPPVANPAAALGIEVLHLLSDVVTHVGLPLPGWVGLMAAGGYGQERLAELARWMYVKGYDTWHLLTMSTSVATVGLVCRGYFGMRRALDREYAKQVAHEAVAGQVGDHPRYQAIALMGHAVATGGNVAKVLALRGNPLALNYAQWVAFARAVAGAVGAVAHCDPLDERAVRNRLALHTEFAELELALDSLEEGFVDASDPSGGW